MASNNTMSILETWSSGELVDLQRTNIKIAIRTNNIIYNQLTHKTTTKQINTNNPESTNLHAPTAVKHVGQTGRSFLVRYSEHRQAFRNNSHTSKFAQHLVEQVHSFGTIHNTMQALKKKIKNKKIKKKNKKKPHTLAQKNVTISTQNLLLITI